MAKRGFTRLDGRTFQKTLVRKFVLKKGARGGIEDEFKPALADKLRDLLVKFGLRSYNVRIVYTRWSGGERFKGQEYVVKTLPILPTPKLEGIGSLDETITAIDSQEFGSVKLSRISGRISEEELTGHMRDGAPLADDETMWWEIEFLSHTGSASKRRFSMAGVPEYHLLSWTVTLERSREDRTRVLGEVN